MTRLAERAYIRKCMFLHSPRGRCYSLDEILRWLREAGFSREKGPFRSNPLPFDTDFGLVANA
jgi:hypothetical protein